MRYTSLIQHQKLIELIGEPEAIIALTQTEQLDLKKLRLPFDTWKKILELGVEGEIRKIALIQMEQQAEKADPGDFWHFIQLFHFHRFVWKCDDTPEKQREQKWLSRLYNLAETFEEWSALAEIEKNHKGLLGITGQCAPKAMANLANIWWEYQEVLKYECSPRTRYRMLQKLAARACNGSDWYVVYVLSNPKSKIEERAIRKLLGTNRDFYHACFDWLGTFQENNEEQPESFDKKRKRERLRQIYYEQMEGFLGQDQRPDLTKYIILYILYTAELNLFSEGNQEKNKKAYHHRFDMWRDFHDWHQEAIFWSKCLSYNPTDEIESTIRQIAKKLPHCVDRARQVIIEKMLETATTVTGLVQTWQIILETIKSREQALSHNALENDELLAFLKRTKEEIGRRLAKLV